MNEELISLFLNLHSLPQVLDKNVSSLNEGLVPSKKLGIQYLHKLFTSWRKSNKPEISSHSNLLCNNSFLSQIKIFFNSTVLLDVPNFTNFQLISELYHFKY